MTPAELDFKEFSHRNPCASCPAPCCRLQLIPYRTPTTFMDIDFVHYMLLFPRTEIVVTRGGEWNIVKWENCGEFDADSLICKMHGTPGKPRTCAMYNPYNCWYKKAFVLDGSPEMYRLDLARFEAWLNDIHFAEDGKISSAPNFERSLEILKDIPIEPCLRPLPVDTLASDPRLNNDRKQNQTGNKVV